MFVILSQRIDFDSSYSDELFNTYHYPSRYKNLLNKGDIFIYYQGNRYDKNQRYYFGVGVVGEINTSDGENYYAKLINCRKFKRRVPIYLPDGGYVEQLDYSTVRKSITPPWQSSIRPLSSKAYYYILKAAGVQSATANDDSVEALNDKLKAAIRDYFVSENIAAIVTIKNIASAIEQKVSGVESTDSGGVSLPESIEGKRKSLAEYCRTMHMSYSYKPLLVLALLHVGKDDGSISIETAAEYFLQFYSERKFQGLPAEKKSCIYQKDNIELNQVISNLISNPVKALSSSGFFSYDQEAKVFFMAPSVWNKLSLEEKQSISSICNQKLKEYYTKK